MKDMQKSYLKSQTLKILFFLIFTFLSIKSCFAHCYPEKQYQKQWCEKNKGIMEYQLDDKTRIDCLLPKYAVEFDFANKWAECIGQSLYYGIKTNRTPACVLIMENGQKDLKYLNRLNQVASKNGIKTFTMTLNDICN